jgi:hypothetical protein
MIQKQRLKHRCCGQNRATERFKGTNPRGARFRYRGILGNEIMTCIKTFSTSFPRIVARLRLAYENGGFTVHNGDLMQIVSFDEIDGGRGVIVDLVPAQLGAHADVWQHAT